MKQNTVELHMPRLVSQRILRRAAQGEACVVTSQHGKPSRVFGYEEYRRIKELPKKVKPWEHRQDKVGGPDPLGAVDGKVLTQLGRNEIYD